MHISGISISLKSRVSGKVGVSSVRRFLHFSRQHLRLAEMYRIYSHSLLSMMRSILTSRSISRSYLCLSGRISRLQHSHPRSSISTRSSRSTLRRILSRDLEIISGLTPTSGLIKQEYFIPTGTNVTYHLHPLRCYRRPRTSLSLAISIEYPQSQRY